MQPSPAGSPVALAPSNEGLVRALGVRGLAAAIINYTVGAGIFVLPAIVAATLGGSAVLAYVVCAFAMALIVMCFASLGSRVSLSGGVYAYTTVAFGPFVGFLVALMMWFGSNVLASATVANILVSSVARVAPWIETSTGKTIFLVATYGFLASINIRGVRLGSAFVQGITVAKLLPLLLLIAAGLFTIEPANLALPGFPGMGDLGRASATLIFAFLGAEAALTPSGEVSDPARTVPRAIFTALAVVTALYLSIQLIAQGILGSVLAATTDAPLAEAARIALGRGGEMLVVTGAAVSTFGYVGGDMLAAPRGLFALGRDGLLPAQLATVHPRFRTPWIAIILHGITCCAFAVTGTFAGLAVLASLATLLVYFACCTATVELQRRDVRSEGSVPFAVPAGPLIPVLASAVVLWLISNATRKEFLAIAAMIGATSLLYLIMQRAWRSAGSTTGSSR